MVQSKGQSVTLAWFIIETFVVFNNRCEGEIELSKYVSASLNASSVGFNLNLYTWMHD
jgi:hypothetical protein